MMWDKTGAKIMSEQSFNPDAYRDAAAEYVTAMSMYAADINDLLRRHGHEEIDVSDILPDLEDIEDMDLTILSGEDLDEYIRDILADFGAQGIQQGQSVADMSAYIEIVRNNPDINAEIANASIATAGLLATLQLGLNGLGAGNEGMFQALTALMQGNEEAADRIMNGSIDLDELTRIIEDMNNATTHFQAQAQGMGVTVFADMIREATETAPEQTLPQHGPQIPSGPGL